MKIMVISTPIFKFGPTGCVGYSGLEHLAWLTAKGLVEKGHSVSLVAPDGSECPGVDMVHVGPERQVGEDQAYKKYWELLPFFDCVVDHSWGKFSYLLKEEGRLKAPVLGVCHAPVDGMFRTLPPVERPCMVCISEDQAAHFRALFSHDCRVAHNGVDPTYYRATGEPRTNRFLFLARFSSVKSPDLAIAACREIGAPLDLVGDTSITNEPEYLTKCMSMTDGDQIRFVGGSTRGATVNWFSQALAMIHPNRSFREPFGLAPVESMMCGCPVVCWDKGAMRETVRHGETGWLVRSTEELQGAVGGIVAGGIPDAMRLRCREWAADNFSVAKMITRYEQLCIEAVDGGGW